MNTPQPTAQLALPKSLSGDRVEKDIAAQAARLRGEDADGRLALAKPYPGPAGDAFRLPADVAVGQWKVRPLYDADLEVLEALDNPMYHLTVLDIADEKKPTPAETAEMVRLEKLLMRGRHAWVLFWVMTRPPEESDKLVQAGMLSEVAARAKEEFGVLQMAEIAALHQAVLKQFKRYTATVVHYEPAGGDEEEGAASRPNPTGSSAAPPTG